MTTKAIQQAVVEFLHQFTQHLVEVDHVPVIKAFKNRPIYQQIAIVPGRLVDDSMAMLAKWREKGINSSRSPLPVFIIGFDKSYASTGLEKGISVAVSDYIVRDDQGNFFKLRLDKHDQRVQIVLFAPNHPTAFTIASQFKLFCADFGHRHLFSITPYNGLHYGFPMKMEDYQIFATSNQITDQDNLTVLVFDLTFNCNTPYFLGDVERNSPYLSVVKTVIINEQDYLNRQQRFHQVVGYQWEESNATTS